MKIQNLLAPCWKDRIKAEQLLMDCLTYDENNKSILPKKIGSQMALLKPSPKVFIPALIHFWADYVEQSFIERMKEFNHSPEPYDRQKWSSDCSKYFPVTPNNPSASPLMFIGIGVWSLIEKLGPYVKLVEKQLVACLEHPESVVRTAAWKGLATAEKISDESFSKLLVYKNRQAINNMESIVRHINKDRLGQIINNLKPDQSDTESMVLFNIIGNLKGEYANIACDHIISQLQEPWSDRQFSHLLYALTCHIGTINFVEDDLSFIQSKIHDQNKDITGMKALFLSSLDPEKFNDTLISLINQGDPYVLTNLCKGLQKHQNVNDKLIKKVISKTLGNYDANDGDPHDSAMHLLLAQGSRVNNYIEIISQWFTDIINSEQIEYSDIANILDISELLADAAQVLKTDLIKALNQLTSYEKNDFPALYEPGAVPIIKQHMHEKLIEIGSSPKEAHDFVKFQGKILEALAENLDEIQSEIDTADKQFDQEMLEMLGSDHDEDDQQYDDQDDEYEEADEIVRLKAKIAELECLTNK